MSIYPVRASKWFVARRTETKEFQEEMRLEASIIKNAIKSGHIECSYCGKVITNYKTCYVSHAFSYGFRDTNYCDKKCLLS